MGRSSARFKFHFNHLLPITLHYLLFNAIGPTWWYKLGYTLCRSGSNQSPINIDTSALTINTQLTVTYLSGYNERWGIILSNTGHTGIFRVLCTCIIFLRFFYCRSICHFRWALRYISSIQNIWGRKCCLRIKWKIQFNLNICSVSVL